MTSSDGGNELKWHHNHNLYMHVVVMLQSMSGIIIGAILVLSVMQSLCVIAEGYSPCFYPNIVFHIVYSHVLGTYFSVVTI